MNWLTRGLRQLWQVHPALALTIQAPPAACLQALAQAAKPSTERLHLRNLFAEGRRYYLQPLPGGFQLTSNSKIPWRRGRTTLAAVLLGEFDDAGGATRLMLRAHMRLWFFLDVFLIPAFVTSILVFAPWPAWTIAGLAALLFGLSWLWHRLTAALQAAEMVYFVQKALEDLPAGNTPALGAANPEVITPDAEFRAQWQKFYDQHQADAS